VHAPDAVVISSGSGHGHLDGTRLISELRADQEPAVAHVPVVIGGKLGINGAGPGGLTARLAPGREPASLAGTGR
jgi:methylaspartate mutase sigma subunit